MKKLNKAEAIDFFETQKWAQLTDRQRAEFQIQQELLCMPFDVFHKSVEKALGRPVWTHEFAKPEYLKNELFGNKQPPSMQEIIDMLPTEKNDCGSSR